MIRKENPDGTISVLQEKVDIDWMARLATTPRYFPRDDVYSAWMNYGPDVKGVSTPIEAGFLAAFMLMRGSHGHLDLVFASNDGSPLSSEDWDCLIEPQATVGNYRVDFQFTVRDVASGVTRRLVVECDGHDFHERTKGTSCG